MGNTGRKVGGGVGMAAGAAAGTAVMPGVGTVAGGMLGYAGGSLIGSMFDDDSVATPTYNVDASGQIAASRDQSQESRESQLRMQQLLEARARGEGPSVAQAQAQQATQQNIAQQASMAASARGGAAVQSAAQRQAMMGGAQAQQQAIGQGAQLRAQEMQQATSLAAQNQAQARSQDLSAMNSEMNLGVSNAQLDLQAQQAKMTADSQQKERDAGILTGMMKGGISLTSDERAKTNIAPGDAETQAFLDALRAKRYQYRGAPGEHVGVIAQDAKRSSVGDDVVQRRPDGYLGFETGKTLGALLASVANLNKRLEGLEGKKHA